MLRLGDWLRPRRRRVLIVDHGIPTPDQDAGSRTMFQVVCLFAGEGFDVDFWVPATRVDRRYRDQLVARGIRLHSLDPAPAPGFSRWLERNGRRIDLVFLSRPQVAARVIDQVRQFCAAKILFYGHDLHHRRLRMEVARTGVARHAAGADALEAMESDIWPRVDTVYYPSREECSHVEASCRERGHTVDARVLPVFGFESFDDPSVLSLRERRGVMFVGGFAHAPNIDGLLWFAREVWPDVVAAAKGTTLTIVGSRPPAEILALAGETIDVRGFVSDEALARVYRSARVAIAPLRFGAGMKGKVAEAMRFGLPMVTTSVGAQGLADAGDALLVADPAERQAELVLGLLGDDALWERTALAASAYARRCFSRDRLWAALAAAL